MGNKWKVMPDHLAVLREIDEGPGKIQYEF